MPRKMTREEELWSMTGNTLLTVAEKLGIATTKSALKKGKEPLIDKILEAEKKLENGSNKKPTEASKKEAKSSDAMTEILEDDKKASKIAKTIRKIYNDEVVPKKEKKVKKEVKKEVKTSETKKEVKKEVKTSGTRSNLKLKELTYKGKTKSIREWAEELNMPWATLYDRVNRNGWTTEEAIETPLGQKKSR